MADAGGTTGRMVHTSRRTPRVPGDARASVLPRPAVAEPAEPADDQGVSTIYDLSFRSIRGEETDLAQYRGRPLLIVNTASRCGLTPQYEELQALHETYGPQGLVVLGFPCDQFAHQEPGDEAQIEQSCRIDHGVTFPLSVKVHVNGGHAHPVFEFVKARSGGLLGKAVKWNFTKFLVSGDGVTVRRYAPSVEPLALAPDIEALLGAVAA